MVCYEDVARLLLEILTIQYDNYHNFIQQNSLRILILLGGIEVNLSKKRMLGDLGAVQVISHSHIYTRV